MCASFVPADRVAARRRAATWLLLDADIPI
jgi:hypothetical protein